MNWRWDQGRLDYFRFDTIQRMSAALCSLENAPLDAAEDPLRDRLEIAAKLPFAPARYRLWRNYKRVFGCCILAAEIGGRLICTEICHKLAAGALGAEEYFGTFARRFYYRSPVFQGYVSVGPQVFPVCAILKLLLARARNGLEPQVAIKDIVEFVIANQCTGREPIAHYANLLPRIYRPQVDEIRQVRELVRFISQLSFLKWGEPNLYLDIGPGGASALDMIEALAQPIVRRRKSDPATELLAMGGTGDLSMIPLVPTPAADGDLSFSEGKPTRASHLRYERSSRLRDMFFRGRESPYYCDMCALDVSYRYPWSGNLLESHHLLPLASPLRVDARRTSLSELVPVCPNCHKATHIYYKRWLNENSQEDFISRDEARNVYEQAKTSMVMSPN